MELVSGGSGFTETILVVVEKRERARQKERKQTDRWTDYQRDRGRK